MSICPCVTWCMLWCQMSFCTIIKLNLDYLDSSLANHNFYVFVLFFMSIYCFFGGAGWLHQDDSCSMSPDNCLPFLVGFHSPTKKFHNNYSKTRGPLSQRVWHVYLYLFEFMLLALALIRAQIGEGLLISTLLSNLFFLSSSVLLFCHDWTSIPGIIKPWCCLLLPDYCIIPPCIYFWIVRFTLGGWIYR